ncbi:MAG: antibiotic biosynthesis monooxygenase [Bdellovibrionales bacterium]|nr:antibiotic biosynthesis monooxygenase [Bdellovibrionales bacterium]NQZ18719.1 antibiotic biosynthesis monooxygenase [Bdellovibrionales bacterium]
MSQQKILRIFEVITKPNCSEKMLENFKSTSTQVVENEPGNLGYYFGKGVASEKESVIFVSIWKDLESIQNRFGENWKESYLPEGYEEIIEVHSLKHIDVSYGWKVSD